MQYAILKQISEHLNRYKYIKYIARMDDTTIVIEFEGKERYFFDLKRGNAHIYKKDETTKAKTYQAPFDMALKKRFLKGSVERVYTPEGTKVITIEVEVKNAYKREKSTLNIEFVGRHTNAVICDENGVITDALRYSKASEEREIRAGERYPAIEARVFETTKEDAKDIDAYLRAQHEKKEISRLSEVKNRALAKVEKECKKYKQILQGLDDEESLHAKSEKEYQKANLLLAHLYEIKPYQKYIVLEDYEGVSVAIDLPEHTEVNNIPNHFFAKAKKAKQKAKNIHIERDNLLSKLHFAQKLLQSVEKSTSYLGISLLVPKKIVSKKDKKAAYLYEVFKIEDFLIYVGKNEKGNVALLKKARSSDMWMHIQEQPSTHVIIKTEKSNISENVLVFAGKLCVDFTNVKAGGYLVDYTKRKFVKTIDGSYVSYTHQKTLKIYKD